MGDRGPGGGTYDANGHVTTDSLQERGMVVHGWDFPRDSYIYNANGRKPNSLAQR